MASKGRSKEEEDEEKAYFCFKSYRREESSKLPSKSNITPTEIRYNYVTCTLA